jgi:hypothetical protein
MRRTYFRLREIKQKPALGIQVKDISRSPPKRHQDFYSHQQAIVKQAKAYKKKLSSTASNFFSNMSKIGQGGSL